MTQLNIEGFIDKNISKIPNATLLYGEDNPYTNTYTLKGNFVFLGKTYNMIYFITDKSGIIKNCSFGINGIIDTSFL
ncbi:hypothetical protein QBK95_05700 [Aquimarina sp. 2201CG14-23]|nr:hypothetical protein [Aquimarina sp. 2201CG14-23]